MPDITPKQRRRGKEYAAELAKLATEAPDAATKRDVYVAVNAIFRRYGLSREGKRREIQKAVEVGASRVTDIARETGIVEQDVREIAREMAREGLIRLEMLQLTGGNGRPAEHFFPA